MLGREAAVESLGIELFRELRRKKKSVSFLENDSENTRAVSVSSRAKLNQT